MKDAEGRVISYSYVGLNREEVTINTGPAQAQYSREKKF